jgi:ATP-dependent Clp protease ATP-binding subunit ClpC
MRQTRPLHDLGSSGEILAISPNRSVGGQAFLTRKIDRKQVRVMTWSCESIAPEAEAVLERAAPEALSLGLDYVGTEAVLLAMIRVGAPELSDTLRRVGSSFTQLEAAIRQSTVGRSFPPPAEPLAFASRAIRAVEYAGQCARTRQHSQISNRDLLVGLLSEKDGLAHSILADIGVDIPTVLAD